MFIKLSRRYLKSFSQTKKTISLLLLLLTTVLLFPIETQAAWYNTDWLYRKTITIDNTQVPGSLDLTNFPVLVNLAADGDLSTKAQADGDDILFTSSDETTKLDHEIEYYNNGTLVAWVRVPTVSYNTNTVIYMYYGNNSIGSQSNHTGVWNTSYYNGVWNLAEDPSTSTDGYCGGGTSEFCDSTSRSLHGDSGGDMTSGDLVTGQADGSLDFDGTSDYLAIGDSAFLDMSDIDFMLTGWFNRDTFDTDDVILAKRNSFDTASDLGYIVYIDSGGDNLIFEISDGTDEFTLTSNTTFTTTGWHHFAVMWDDDLASNTELYIDGVDDNAVQTGTITSIGVIDNGVDFRIASESDGASYFDGKLDAIRAYGTGLTSDWLITEYNNQSSPGTFYSLGSETIVPSGYNQSSYRWFGNTDTTDVGSALAAQNAPYSFSGIGDVFRLRATLHILYSQLSSSGQQFKLQYAEQTGTCDSLFTGETYADVTTTSPIAYYNNPSVLDGATLTDNANDPAHSGHTNVNQTYEESNNFTNGVAAIPAGSDGMWDFALHDYAAVGGQTYCLRIVNSGGGVLDDYEQIAELSFNPSLTFTISSVGANTLTNGITTTEESSYSMLPFGHISVGEVNYVAHQLYVESNAEHGYTVTVRIDPSAIIQGLDPVNVIDPFAASGVSWTNPLAWTSPNGTVSNVNSGWIGANTSDTRVNGWSSGSGKFGPLTQAQAYPVMSATSYDSGTSAYVTYAIEVNTLQPTDTYSGRIQYTVTPTY